MSDDKVVKSATRILRDSPLFHALQQERPVGACEWPRPAMKTMGEARQRLLYDAYERARTDG